MSAGAQRMQGPPAQDTVLRVPLGGNLPAIYHEMRARDVDAAAALDDGALERPAIWCVRCDSYRAPQAEPRRSEIAKDCHATQFQRLAGERLARRRYRGRVAPGGAPGSRASGVQSGMREIRAGDVDGDPRRTPERPAPGPSVIMELTAASAGTG